MISCLVPGSFDPPTKGHLDVVERCAGIFDRVIIAVVANPAKQSLFTEEQRKDLLRECSAQWDNVEVDSFSGLLVDFASTKGADVIVKGLRAMTDFDYEIQMSQMNRHLYSDAETVFLTPKEEYTFLSSRVVKEVVALGGDVTGLVPDPVRERLEARLSKATHPPTR